MSNPTAPPFAYLGGKGRLAHKIISHFPQHTRYVEPFGGAASVLLARPPAAHEIYNDIDGALVNFFSVLRNDSDALTRLIELTPYSRAEFEAARASAIAGYPDATPLERARLFYVLMKQSGRGRNEPQRRSWRTKPRKRGGRSLASEYTAGDERLHTIAARLRSVQIEQMDAIECIKYYDGPGALLYIDPPYLDATRTGGRAYNYEYGDSAQHEALAAALHAAQGAVVLSGYASDLYAQLYPHWRRVDFAAASVGGGARVDCLWIKPGDDNLRSLPLFDTPAPRVTSAA